VTVRADPFAFEQLVTPAPPAPVETLANPVETAGALIAAAESTAERIRQDARDAGFEAGRQEGLAEVRAQLEPASRALAEALEQLRAARLTVTDRLEAHAVELAFMLTEKVLAGALGVQPERVLDVVRGTLRLLADRDRVTIVVNPDDLEIVSEGIDEITGALGGIAALDLQGDRRVGRGGAVLRTPVGEIDGTLDTKLERAREVLERELMP
jgi:flagellar assembly protein FliH